MNGRSLAWPIAWTVLHGVLWLLPIGALLFIVPRSEQRFADFGIEVSSETILTIRASHTVRQLLPVVVLGLVAVLALDFAMIRNSQSTQRRRWAGIEWAVLMTVVPLAAIAMVALTILVPLFNLQSRLAG